MGFLDVFFGLLAAGLVGTVLVVAAIAIGRPL